MRRLSLVFMALLTACESGGGGHRAKVYGHSVYECAPLAPDSIPQEGKCIAGCSDCGFCQLKNGYCVPGSDADCGDVCWRAGLCKVNATGNACVPRTDKDCLESYDCSFSGDCSLSEDGTRCRVESAADCVYACGQFGKCHVVEDDEGLPTCKPTSAEDCKAAHYCAATGCVYDAERGACVPAPR